MDKRQAKKKRLNRFSWKKLLRYHKRLDKMMSKHYKPRPITGLEIHTCFLPFDLVLNENDLKENTDVGRV